VPCDRRPSYLALTAALVLALAAFATVASYSHIYDLGRAHGQAGTAARLLPLSVDGLIVAASLVLPHELRLGRRAPVLARLMLALGVSDHGRQRRLWRGVRRARRAHLGVAGGGVHRQRRDGAQYDPLGKVLGSR
jgi:hypothetical protein